MAMMIWILTAFSQHLWGRGVGSAIVPFRLKQPHQTVGSQLTVSSNIMVTG